MVYERECMHRAGHVRSLWIISGVDSKLFVRVIRVTMTGQWARDRWFIVSSLTKPSDQILQNAKFQWFGWYWIHRVHRFPVNSINNSNKYVVEFVSREQVVKILKLWKSRKQYRNRIENTTKDLGSLALKKRDTIVKPIWHKRLVFVPRETSS